MKELMVTLLVLSCTGMVLAQQEHNNGFRTNGGSSAAGSPNDRSGGGLPPMVPIVTGQEDGAVAGSTANRAQSDRDKVRSSFDPNSSRTRSSTSSGGTPLNFRSAGMSGSGLSDTASARRNDSETSSVNREDYFLGLPSNAIADLKKFGSVDAGIRNSWVNRIMISDPGVRKGAQEVPIEPELRGDTLVFRLSENQLAHIDEVAFVANVPEQFKGRIKKATIEYPPTLQAIRASQTAPVGQRFQADDNRWHLAGDTRERTPIRQTDPWKDNNLNRDRNLTDLERQRELDRIELQRKENQRIAYEQMLRDREKMEVADENRQLATQNQRLQNQLDEMRRQALSRTQPGLYPPNRVADNSWLVGQPASTTRPLIQQPVVQPASSDTLAVTMMQNQVNWMKNRIAQLDNDLHSTKAANESIRQDNEAIRRLFDINNGRQTDLVDHQLARRDRADETKPNFPDRPVISTGRFANTERDRNGLRNRDGSLNDTTAGATTTGSDRGTLNDKGTSGDQGWKLMMFLMLLCSVALNLYLWAIARGSYMRYEELANELRETFTVTA